VTPLNYNGCQLPDSEKRSSILKRQGYGSVNARCCETSLGGSARANVQESLVRTEQANRRCSVSSPEASNRRADASNAARRCGLECLTSSSLNLRRSDQIEFAKYWHRPRRRSLSMEKTTLLRNFW